MKRGKLTQRIALHGIGFMTVPAKKGSLPSWPELNVVLCRPKEYYTLDFKLYNSWNVIECRSGQKVNIGCVSPTRKQAVIDAEKALNSVAETKGREKILSYVKLLPAI